MIPLQPPHRYMRRLPNVFEFACGDPALEHTFFNRLAVEVLVPEEGYCELGNASLIDGMQVIDSTFSWVSESLQDFTGTPRLADLSQRIAAGDVVAAPPIGRIDVAVAKQGVTNYGHFLFDILPKLVHLFRSHDEPIRLFYPLVADTYLHFLHAYAVKSRRDVLFQLCPPDSIVAIPRLRYFTAVSEHSIRTSRTLLMLREELLRFFGSDRRPWRKLLIVRNHPTTRAFFASEAVERFFIERGFEPVELSEMSVEHQIRLFSEATHIAGVPGAGFANILFAPVSAEILLIDPGLGDPVFWDVAALIGQPFHWYFSGVLQGHCQVLAAGAVIVHEPSLAAAMRRLGWRA